ncbi:MAG TPA: MoxR family ATPase [Cytophagaceae bacterium]|nr:MoxR family ATPase [Cytophagaceae bacterium]
MENQELFNSRTDLSELRNAVEQLRSEIAKIVVGQHQMVDLILSAILADGHVLIEGVPGVAKTLTAKIVARTISSGFSRIQFTPDLMPSDVLGTSVYNSKNSEFEFKKGPIFSNIVLIDEINRAPAKTQSALFEVMEERQVTIDGTTYKMAPPFIVLATQNPVEQEGTYRLPEAQLDRFIYKIEIGYPSLEEEEKILTGFHQRKSSNDLNMIAPILSGEQIQQYREKVNNLHIDQNLVRYISQIVNQTRNNSALYLGASPRASIAIMRGAKAMAAMRGRDFVTPEDIKDVTYPVLGHRIMLTAEKEMEGLTAKDIIKEIITKVEVPR